MLRTPSERPHRVETGGGLRLVRLPWTSPVYQTHRPLSVCQLLTKLCLRPWLGGGFPLCWAWTLPPTVTDGGFPQGSGDQVGASNQQLLPHFISLVALV